MTEDYKIAPRFKLFLLHMISHPIKVLHRSILVKIFIPSIHPFVLPINDFNDWGNNGSNGSDNGDVDSQSDKKIIAEEAIAKEDKWWIGWCLLWMDRFLKAEYFPGRTTSNFIGIHNI